jgi:heme/copper-type cytochrome/quinol oxidase subunit 4
MKSNAHRKGLKFAGIHTLLFFLMIIGINSSNDGQAPMAWVIFAFIDLPISLLYFAHAIFKDLITFFGESSFVAKLFYPPYIIHGLFGSIWWYFLPRFFMSKKVGGVWGKRKSETET